MVKESPLHLGGGVYYICLCFFCALETQKYRNKQQYLQSVKMLKTRMNKGKPRISAGFSLAEMERFELSNRF
jgi:hypothetical protein